MMRPLADHHNPKAIDESTDTYDTVAWLIKNVPGNNGRVGVVGTSYPGFLAMMAGIDPHPAVKAISPQAPMIDVWIGDDFFHNGAFRQTYGYDYVLSMESSKQITDVGYGKDKERPTRRRLRLLSRARQLCRRREKVRRGTAAHLEALPRSSRLRFRLVFARRGAPSQRRRRAHPHRGRLLRPGRYVRAAGGVRHSSSRTTRITRTFSSWVRGGMVTGRSSSRHLGNLDYGEPIGNEFRARIEAKFFAHYLKDEPRLRPRRHGQLSDRIEHLEVLLALPAHRIAPHQPLSSGRGSAQLERLNRRSHASYISDPANPVPYRHRPIQPTYSTAPQWYNWLTEDQRFVTDRKDVAVWKLPVLKRI